MNVHSSFIYNSHNLQTNQMTFNRYMDTLWYFHIMEYHSTRQRNELLIHTVTWIDLKSTMLSAKKKKKKEPISKD